MGLDIIVDYTCKAYNISLNIHTTSAKLGTNSLWVSFFCWACKDGDGDWF